MGRFDLAGEKNAVWTWMCHFLEADSIRCWIKDGWMMEGEEDVQYNTVCMDWRLGFYMLRSQDGRVYKEDRNMLLKRQAL